MQMAHEVPESWCRWLMRFQEVPGQMAKILPRSSKLLGITHEFIFFDELCQIAKG